MVATTVGGSEDLELDTIKEAPENNWKWSVIEKKLQKSDIVPLTIFRLFLIGLIFLFRNFLFEIDRGKFKDAASIIYTDAQ